MVFLADLSPLIENAFFAVSGAAIASALVWLVRRLRDWRHERQFSISGAYRTYYEDVIHGESVVHSESIILKQRGLKVVAKHDGRDTDQGWLSEGRIDPVTKYITGYYRAKSVTDAGVGVFILAPKSERVLDGIWAGYNSVTREITHGRYTFRQTLPVTVRRATRNDMVAVMELASSELGEDYLTLDAMEEHFKNDLVYVADHQEIITGFAIGRTIKAGGLRDDVMKGQDYKVPNDILLADAQGQLGLLQSVATDNVYKGQGVGNQLVKVLVKALESKGAKQIVSIGWTTDTVHIGTILEAYNFKQRATFEKFWAKESLRKNYECPDCGAPPCECTATLFSRS